MRRELRRAPTAATLALLLVVVGAAGCSDDGSGDEASPTTTSPTTTTEAPAEDETTPTTSAPEQEEDGSTTTSAPSETAPPPEEIDAAYVEDIAGLLLERWQAALAAVRAEGAVTPTVRALLGTTFVPAAANAVATEIEQGGGPAFVVPEPTAATIASTEVVESVDGCVEASASIDVSGLLATPPPGEATWYFRLEEADAAANETPWRFAYIGPSLDGEPPEVGCS